MSVVTLTSAISSISLKPKSDFRMTRLLSRTFRSLNPHRNNNIKKSSSSSASPSTPPPPSLRSSSLSSASPSRSLPSWSVYLIISTNKPLKTYVGVTTDFTRRLKQHNGDLKGGAKASRAGRPWNCACIIRGFKDHSQACQFETKWKSCSRKLPRKNKTITDTKESENENGSLALLQHRHKALDKIRDSFDFSQLEIDWKLDPFSPSLVKS